MGYWLIFFFNPNQKKPTHECLSSLVHWKQTNKHKTKQNKQTKTTKPTKQKHKTPNTKQTNKQQHTRKMQLASWLWMSANSLSRKDFFSCLSLKIEDENRVHKVSQRSSLDPPPHSPPIPAPSRGSRPSWNTAHLGHGWDMSIKGWRCCAFSRVKQLGREKKVFSSAAFSCSSPSNASLPFLCRILQLPGATLVYTGHS